LLFVHCSYRHQALKLKGHLGEGGTQATFQ